MTFVLNLTRTLIARIDAYLDAISEGLLVFSEGTRAYLENNAEGFEDRLLQIDQMESRADELRREIESYLYSHSLIPELRGDVLGLLEHLDDIIDTAKDTLTRFSVEVPDLPMELAPDYLQLAEAGVHAGEMIVQASRAFFTDLSRVKDHIHKVYFYEHEADRIADRLKRAIFRRDMELARKLHLRDMTDKIALISDRAEDVADRLSIYAIKRSL